MKTFSLFFLTNLGLSLPFQGEITAFSKREVVEKAPRTPNSGNLLGQGNGRSVEMLVNTSGVTVDKKVRIRDSVNSRYLRLF